MSRKRMSDKSLVSIIDEDELQTDDTAGDDLFSEPETITTDSNHRKIRLYSSRRNLYAAF